MLRKGVSALGRMESSAVGHRDNIPHIRNEKVLGTGKKGVMSMDVFSPDSEDKENWLPGEGMSMSSARRPLPSYKPRSSEQRSPLKAGMSGRAVTGSTPLGRRRGKRTGGETKIFEDESASVEEGEGEPSEEVREFMRGAVSPSKKGDLDCIQGLLSLSQGNWR